MPAIRLTKTAQYTGMGNLAGLTVDLREPGGVVVAGPFSRADPELEYLGGDFYAVTLTTPVDYTVGYLLWQSGSTPNVPLAEEINALELTAISSGFGEHVFTATVETAGGVPLVGAVVSVRQGGVTLYWAYTDSAGKARFNLAAGSYTVSVSAGGAYVQVVDQALVVDGDEAVTYALATSTPAPPAVGLCAVRFQVALNGVAQAGYVCAARLIGSNSTATATLLSSVVDRATTNENGIADLLLVQVGQFVNGEGLYEITVTAPTGSVTHCKRTTIPNAATVNFEDLL